MSDIDEYNSGDSDSESSTSSSEKIVIKKIISDKNPTLEEEENIEIEDEEDELEEEDNSLLDEEDEVSDEDDELDEENDEYDINGGAKNVNTNASVKKKENKTKIIPKTTAYSSDNEDGDDEDEDNDDFYLQKMDAELNKNYIVDFHPECSIHNYDEISIFTHVVRDNNNNIIDDLHKTIPFLTKYEKARILGQRAKQINSGGKPFIKVPENVIDGYIIAELELQQKRIPFIIRRPFPGGGSEYWNLRDLEIITF
jgi:DNA-directed RNA polymerase subunit K/omega